jgi:hypothetical protein
MTPACLEQSYQRGYALGCSEMVSSGLGGT